ERRRLAEPRLHQDAAVGIDHAGDPRVRGAYDRQTLLDGTQSRADEVLIRPGADAVPAVIGDVEQPLRAVASVDDVAREYRFITDQRPDRRQPRQSQRAWTRTRRKIRDPRRELRDERQEPMQRHIFAERHQMKFVVAADNLSAAIDDGHAVPDLLP